MNFKYYQNIYKYKQIRNSLKECNQDIYTIFVPLKPTKPEIWAINIIGMESKLE